ncbi:MAG TPA: NlpC/P60 family protein [Panacibacter sp.]|nr:NlpC/P60 family protein [Panacibacter sp.]HNP46399.1 NlpC/P60 family protein [Panacibacter sp.]
MNRLYLRYALLLSVAFTSCKSMQHLAAKDNSGSSKKSNTNNGESPRFLDDISVTPGTQRVSKIEGTSPAKSIPPKPFNTKNLEDAAYMQVKYATILDIPVESVSNMLLFENIDYWWGTKYCLGGSTESCIDCSAFTQTLMSEVYKTHIPRTAQQQYDSSAHIDSYELTEGDLVFFQTSGRGISHVGVYIANNKFAHASVSSGVIISDLNESYWKTKYRGAGRVLK